jgi:integrase
LSGSLSGRKRLTDLIVARITPPASGHIWIPDAWLPTFGIRVYPTGRRAWGVLKRWDGAKHPSFRKVGEFPELSTAEARTKARELLERGVQPKTVADFTQIAEQFLQHGRTRKGRELRQNSVDQYRRILARCAKRLGKHPFTEISRRDIADLLRDVANKSGSTSASLTRATLARLWSHAISVGVVENNVVTGTPSYAVAKRSRVLSDVEIARLWRATEEPTDFAMIVRICLWCGCRRSEAGGMAWAELDGGVWTVPGSRTKNGRALVLPLATQTREAIARWPRIVGRDQLFGRNSARGFGSWADGKTALDARLGFAQSWCLHDLRRTTETRLIGIGFSRTIVNKILNHGMTTLEQSYDHYSYTVEKREALQQWANELEKIVHEHKPTVLRLPVGQNV